MAEFDRLLLRLGIEWLRSAIPPYLKIATSIFVFNFLLMNFNVANAIILNLREFSTRMCARFTTKFIFRLIAYMKQFRKLKLQTIFSDSRNKRAIKPARVRRTLSFPRTYASCMDTVYKKDILFVHERLHSCGFSNTQRQQKTQKMAKTCFEKKNYNEITKRRC